MLTLVVSALIPVTSANAAVLSLREQADKAGITIGSGAINPDYLDDPAFARTLGEQFNSLSPENELKWAFSEPQQGMFDFTKLDRLVSFAQEHHMAMKAHGLISGGVNPSWLEQITDPVQLRAVMVNHFKTLMTRYAGKMDRWDVVTEVLSTFGGTGLEHNYFYRVLGPDYIAEAFRMARAANPHAKLFINESLVEFSPVKRQELYDLVSGLVRRGVPIDGVGLEMHETFSGPEPGVITDIVNSYKALGLDIAITELDVHLTPLPDNAEYQQQGQIYADIVNEALAAGVRDINVWGFTDKHSYTWVPGARPLMFDEQYNPKPAFFATWNALASHAYVSPQKALSTAGQHVQALVDAGALAASNGRPLTNMIQSAAKQLDIDSSLDRSSSQSTVVKLRSAIKFTQNLIARGDLSSSDGDGLIHELSWVLSKLD